MANFLKAIEWMEEGNKVRVSSWGNKDYFWYVDDKFSFDNLWCIRQPDGGDACMILSWVLSKDWVKCNYLKFENEEGKQICN